MAQVISRTDVKSTDAGQLMFYLVSHALKALRSGIVYRGIPSMYINYLIMYY